MPLLAVLAAAFLVFTVLAPAFLVFTVLAPAFLVLAIHLRVVPFYALPQRSAHPKEMRRASRPKRGCAFTLRRTITPRWVTVGCHAADFRHLVLP